MSIIVVLPQKFLCLFYNVSDFICNPTSKGAIYKRDIAEWKWVQKRKEVHEALNECNEDLNPPSQEYIEMPMQPPEVDYRYTTNHYDPPSVHYNHDHHGYHATPHSASNVPRPHGEQSSSEDYGQVPYHYHTGDQYHRRYGDAPIYDQRERNFYYEEGSHYHDNRQYSHPSGYDGEYLTCA